MRRRWSWRTRRPRTSSSASVRNGRSWRATQTASTSCSKRCSTHFLEHPDPNGFKAQLVAVDRKACALYKEALDAKLKARGLPPEWSDVIISERPEQRAATSQRFEYAQAEAGRPDRLLQAHAGRVGRRGTGSGTATTTSKWRPPLKILIVCDRLLTGFDAPVEQVMYLDKPLRDHNLLQAIARTNRPLPSMKKRTGVVVDYFGVFTESGEGAELRREHPRGVADRLGCAARNGARRGCAVHGAVRGHHDRGYPRMPAGRACGACVIRKPPRTSSTISRAWNGCGRRSRPTRASTRTGTSTTGSAASTSPTGAGNAGSRDTYGELSAKTRQLIQENTTFIDIAEALPVFKIDKDYVTKLDELPTPADKAAALGGRPHRRAVRGRPELHLPPARRAAAAAQGAQGRGRRGRRRSACASLRRSQTRLQRRSRSRSASTSRSRASTGCSRFCARTPQPRTRLMSPNARERMVAHLRANKLLSPGWSNSIGGRMRVEQSLLGRIMEPAYAALGFDPDAEDPPFLKPAVSELAKSDGVRLTP